MTDAASVCVIIAAFNASTTIGKAVRSALKEPEVTEVFVIDDCSIDNTIETARACDDGSGRLKVLVQQRNQGPSAARNRALTESKTTWVCVLDSDDYFLPGRIKGLLSHAQDTDMVADDLWRVIQGKPEVSKISFLGTSLTEPRTVSFTEFVLSNVTQKNRKGQELGFIKPLIRRTFLDKHRIRYQENIRLGEDFELYTRALGSGARLLIIPPQGYIAIERPDSLSKKHSIHDLLMLREGSKKLLEDLALSNGEKRALRKHYLSIDCRLQWRLLIEAIKEKNIKAALLTFCRPYPVPFYLMDKLGGEVYERWIKSPV